MISSTMRATRGAGVASTVFFHDAGDTSQVKLQLLCLESDLQKRFEHHDPHELMKELKAIFETHAAVECYEASKHFFSCMMEEGSSVSEHMLAMTGHAKKLSDLGIVIPNRLGINRVLQSPPPSYKNFVMNYNMQNMNKELPELFGMLKAAEIEIKKEHQVLMVNKTTSFKKQGKSKGKFKKGGKKAATPPMKPKNGPKPDAECYYCKEKGHWNNCSKYLADLKSGLVKKKKEEIQLSGKSPEFISKVLFFQKIYGARRASLVRLEAPHTLGRRAQEGRAAPRVASSAGLRRLSGLFKGFDLKTRDEKSKSQKLQNAAAVAKLRLGTKNSVLAPPDGELEEIIAIITTDASPSTINVSPIHV
ncbi:hypothetical protein QYE76_011994 [Lolium multiflorum]|uniref:Retrotransposon gag domain-containing protein n=1 Tax=Lolium multiflorum TaxID=4521 RepID=A0AAD8X5V7_LOLMU|nr:hypothetical protein QYE76_011994 [Lolium multiflorum]